MTIDLAKGHCPYTGHTALSEARAPAAVWSVRGSVYIGYIYGINRVYIQYIAVTIE